MDHPAYAGKAVVQACEQELQWLFVNKVAKKSEGKQRVELEALSLFVLEGWESKLPVCDLTFGVSVPLRYAKELGLTSLEECPEFAKVIDGKKITFLTNINFLHSKIQYAIATA